MEPLEVKKQTDKSWLKYFHHFCNEVMEASISLLIISVALNKGFDWQKLFQLALGIGAITFVLEHVHPDYNMNLKQGISWSSGAALVTVL